MYSPDLIDFPAKLLLQLADYDTPSIYGAD